MKVLLATPKDKTVLGTVGGYCANALRQLGHDVSIFDFRPSPYAKDGLLSRARSTIRKVFPSAPSISNMPAVRSAIDHKLNRDLLNQIEAYQPDIFLALLGENIYPETLENIREMKAVTVNWLFDTIILPHRLEFMRKAAPFYDHIILIDSLDVLKEIDFKAEHIESIPLGCDPAIHHRIKLSSDEMKRYFCDVAFVGTVTPDREKMLELLSDFKLGIWGRLLQHNSLLKRYYRGTDIYGSDAVKIYNAAKIVIDIHNRFPGGYKIFNVTPRVFEVPASGGFLITNNIPQLAELYKIGEEIATYDNIDDLRRQITYYLSHESERIAIAKRGYDKAHQDHRYLNRLKTLIGYIRNS